MAAAVIATDISKSSPRDVKSIRMSVFPLMNSDNQLNKMGSKEEVSVNRDQPSNLLKTAPQSFPRGGFVLLGAFGEGGGAAWDGVLLFKFLLFLMAGGFTLF